MHAICLLTSCFHIKSRVVFACGSVEYLSETGATSEDGVMVWLMMGDDLNHRVFCAVHLLALFMLSSLCPTFKNCHTLF